MNLKYFLSLLICSISFLTKAQKDIKEIEKVMATQEQAWNEGNVGKFMEGYWNNDSLCFVDKSGLTFGWKQTLANYKKNYPDKETMGKLVFTLLKKEKLGNENYLIIGKWHLTRKEEVGGHFSLVWKKINGKWVIISDHTS
jgi:ketosteroid isomerase-like protein